MQVVHTHACTAEQRLVELRCYPACSPPCVHPSEHARGALPRSKVCIEGAAYQCFTPSEKITCLDSGCVACICADKVSSGCRHIAHRSRIVRVCAASRGTLTLQQTWCCESRRALQVAHTHVYTADQRLVELRCYSACSPPCVHSTEQLEVLCTGVRCA